MILIWFDANDFEPDRVRIILEQQASNDAAAAMSGEYVFRQDILQFFDEIISTTKEIRENDIGIGE